MGEKICDSFGMWSETTGRLKQFPALELGMRLRGIESQEKKERCRSVFISLVTLGEVAIGLSGTIFGSWELG